MHSLSRSVLKLLTSVGLAVLSATHASAAELNIAVSDIGAGNQPAGGGLVDVIHSQQRLEKALAAQGVTVKWHFFKGAAPLINEAFANGQLDMAYLGDLGSIVGTSAGLDTRVIAAAARGGNHYLAVAPGSPIHSVADLRGKRVGLFRGTAAQLSFAAALHSAGMTEKDLNVINLDFAAASAALGARQIDATWGGMNILALRERGQADVPFSTHSLGGAGELSGLVLVTGKLVNEHPQWVHALVEAQRQAASWAVQNHDAYIQLLAEQSGYSPALLRADLDASAPLADVVSPELDAAFVARLQADVNAARDARLIRHDIDVGQWLAPQFLQQTAP
ncbi:MULTISPECIES: ABC transporter substrate-binding protein [unclassified Pseudomonas]|uniref:ABC transporter substrate-binding protein n=1 Tax=unclassified Pseudomonas TaxID=196821 RepID=UPI0025D926F3|nr:MULTISPECIES: ABC transporter substrate-binding protein [unclassified Pseudomonas]